VVNPKIRTGRPFVAVKKLTGLCGHADVGLPDQGWLPKPSDRAIIAHSRITNNLTRSPSFPQADFDVVSTCLVIAESWWMYRVLDGI